MRVAIGMDIGGTSVKMGLVSRAGRVLSARSVPTAEARGCRAQLLLWTRHARELADEARRMGASVAGIGIGAPGPVDARRGFVYFFPNIPGWKNVPLRDLLRRRTGFTVRVDNDANAMALGEFRHGAGRGATDVVFLTLGTGVGGGLVIGGRLFDGPSYSAAEIGHLVIDERGPRCACGNRGCLETFVGNGYLVAEARRRLAGGERSVLARWTAAGHRLDPILLGKAARAGDRLAAGIWERAGDRLGTALAGLVNILNPQRIILGGGVAQNGRLIFDPVRRAIAKKAFPVAARSVKVLPAKLGTDAGLVGAASLVF